MVLKDGENFNNLLNNGGDVSPSQRAILTDRSIEELLKIQELEYQARFQEIYNKQQKIYNIHVSASKISIFWVKLLKFLGIEEGKEWQSIFSWNDLKVSIYAVNNQNNIQ